MKGIAIPLTISAIILSTVLVAGEIDSGIEEQTIYDEWKKFNLITLAYIIDLANWSSMDCQEKQVEVDKGMSMKKRIFIAEPFEPSEINPISFSLEKCLESKK